MSASPFRIYHQPIVGTGDTYGGEYKHEQDGEVRLDLHRHYRHEPEGAERELPMPDGLGRVARRALQVAALPLQAHQVLRGNGEDSVH